MCVNVRTPTDWILMHSHAQVRCEQKCVNKQGSYVCEYENSYRLILMHSHAQERCEQKYVTKPGSYVCECVSTLTD